MGHTNVGHYPEGEQGWMEAGLPVEKGAWTESPARVGGVMRLNPHLQFDGQCESAFKFYEQCLGGRIVVMMTYGESPGGEQMQAEWRKRILHTTLSVGNYLL